MEPKRFMVRCAVHLFLVKDGKVLVEKRKNRDYCNNQLDVIASHIIGNESVVDAIIRTAKFEVNINVDHLNNDYDVDKVADRVRKIIVKDAGYRNVTQVRNFR